MFGMFSQSGLDVQAAALRETAVKEMRALKLWSVVGAEQGSESPEGSKDINILVPICVPLTRTNKITVESIIKDFFKEYWPSLYQHLPDGANIRFLVCVVTTPRLKEAMEVASLDEMRSYHATFGLRQRTREEVMAVINANKTEVITLFQQQINDIFNAHIVDVDWTKYECDSRIEGLKIEYREALDAYVKAYRGLNGNTKELKRIKESHALGAAIAEDVTKYTKRISGLTDYIYERAPENKAGKECVDHVISDLAVYNLWKQNLQPRCLLSIDEPGHAMKVLEKQTDVDVDKQMAHVEFPRRHYNDYAKKQVEAEQAEKARFRGYRKAACGVVGTILLLTLAGSEKGRKVLTDMGIGVVLGVFSTTPSSSGPSQIPNVLGYR